MDTLETAFTANVDTVDVATAATTAPEAEKLEEQSGRPFPLGFGCMRFPSSDDEVDRLIVHAIEAGVTHFDTAYVYGQSEARLGKVLAQHGLREKVNIATKVQPIMLRKPEDFEKYLAASLSRLQTDYIDYYQIHMMASLKIWNRLVNMGVAEWLEAQKASGRIRNFGFSYHGGREEFVRIVDAYKWDFTLVQYNYLDKTVDSTDDALHYAHTMGLKTFVMSPLKGGRLVDSLPKAAVEAFAAPDSTGVVRTPEEWALRWLWNQPEIDCVYSGMNSMEQLEENIRVAKESTPGMLTDSDQDTIASARKGIIDLMKVSCTACNYCLPCPEGVDIPTCLINYNNIALEGRAKALVNYASATMLKEVPSNASRCTHCGRCEVKCPQKIEIRRELLRVESAFEPFYFKPLIALIRCFMKLS